MNWTTAVIIYVILFAIALAFIVGAKVQTAKEDDKEMAALVAPVTEKDKEKTPWVTLILGLSILVICYRVFDLYFVRVINWIQNFLS